MKVVNSVLYVAVLLSSGKTALYQLLGTKLSRYKTTQVRLISQNPFPVAQPLFDYKGNIGVHLRTSLVDVTDPVTDPLIVYGTEEAGQFSFIHSYGRAYECFAVGFDGLLYGTVSGGQLWYYLDNNTAYQSINYRSLWIPVQNLTAIDIYYETPPQSNSDKINVTIQGRGEDVPNNFQSITLNSITNANGTLPNRSRLDLQGFTGDLLRILLTTNNNGAWRPIIRQIVLLDDK